MTHICENSPTASPTRHRFAEGDVVVMLDGAHGVIDMVLAAGHYRVRDKSGDITVEHDFDLMPGQKRTPLKALVQPLASRTLAFITPGSIPYFSDERLQFVACRRAA